jgi:hypothetical protein
MTGRTMAGLAGLALTGSALAGAVRAAETPAEGIRQWLTPIVVDRARVELVDWFEPPAGAARAGAERYVFFANQLRFGAKLTVPHLNVVLEGQDVRLVSLPDDATLPPPQGNLGPGALYFAHSHGVDEDRNQGETTLRQGYATVGDVPRLRGLSLTGGRFEYSDGLETIPTDPSLAWLKRARIGERLVGPFNYTHIGRSFDGGKVVWDDAAANVTAVGFRPTHGGFEVSSTRELGDVFVAGLAGTLKRLPRITAPVDVRGFYLYYEDRRFSDEREETPLPVKVDNRPLPERVGEENFIGLHTVGMHAVTVVPLGPGKVDGLLWSALQRGDWGALDHAAWAYAVEAGYQLPGVFAAPWLRVGYNQSSGDDDPTDGDHETFFQMLPTARIYAQFPFFNLMNSQDLFTQLVLKPHPRVSLRADYHWLRLSEKKDLWYAGGGATNDDVFGFAGIPANDRRELAHLVDLGLTVTVLKQLSTSLYYGHAFGQGVVGKTFAGTDADYGYVEATFRY